MTISRKIEDFIGRASWIRKMFEEGARLKAIHGAENVFDFSLGNPNLEPPESFEKALIDSIKNAGKGAHAYMPNTGIPSARAAVAEYVSKEQETALTADDIIMTCGAAGALNVIFKTILDPGDEVIVPAPYFVEYNFYADNHGGSIKTVKTNSDFTLDLSAIEEAISEKTKAVLINSPNNPTGQIYDKPSLEKLGKLLEEKSKALGKVIYLLTDEPYRKIIYDGATVPAVFPCYANTILATSYSKDISIPGERIGFIALNPAAEYKAQLIGGMALANRILGFVNAPALMQRAVAAIQGAVVDISAYAKKRKLLCDGLKEAGYEFVTPPGAFYLFVKSPIADDVKFVQALQEEQILVVPGSGFMGPGHFRIAFCVADETIVNAMPGFKRVRAKF